MVTTSASIHLCVVVSVCRLAHVATKNTCKCYYGLAASGKNCTENHAHICHSCDPAIPVRLDEASRKCLPKPGYHQDQHGRVQFNECRCPHGTHAIEVQCPVNGAHICESCDPAIPVRLDEASRKCLPKPGYHLDQHGRLHFNECRCLHGINALKAQCPVNGGNQCISCALGFHLTPHRTCAKDADRTSGQFHLYKMQDGAVWASGRNDFGQLGDNTTDDHTRPVKVMYGVKEISMGSGFSLFLREHGIAYGVGRNGSGQLPSLENDRGASLASTDVVRTPVVLMKGVDHISAAADHSWFLMANGTLWSSQSEAEGGGVIDTDVKEISAQGACPMYLKLSNTAFIRISLSTPLLPAISVKIAKNVHQVASNKGVSLILNADGKVSGWISKSCQGGNGKIARDELFTALTPSMEKNFSKKFRKAFRNSMQPLFTRVSRVAAGHCFAIALTDNGEIWVAGDNSKGQLGVPNVGHIDWDKPVRVHTSGSAKDVFAGDGFAVFTMEEGYFLASGRNAFGQFGDGSTHSRTGLGGCGASPYLVSGAKLGSGFGHMPLALCQFCRPGHFVNISSQRCMPCPPMMMSKTVIHAVSGCNLCRAGTEPTLHQNGCMIADKMRFLKAQMPRMLAWLLAYTLIVAVVLVCKTWILPKYAPGSFAYKALGEEPVLTIPSRLKSRFWRIIRLPQPPKWPWWFHAGGDFVDWSILLVWYDKSMPAGKLADFEADYNLALATTVLLYFGPFLPLLMCILPRPAYLVVEVVYDATELLVVWQSGFKASTMLNWANRAATVLDLVLLKGPEAVDLLLNEWIPGVTQVLDCCDPEGRPIYTMLDKEAAPNAQEIVVSPVYGLQIGNVIAIDNDDASEQLEITGLTNDDNTLVIAIAEPLKQRFLRHTLVKRPRVL